MPKIFTSYSHEDSQFVDQLCNRLEAEGMELWRDRLDIAGGESWRAQIIEGIKASDALVVVLSPNSARSRYVSRELTLADEYRTKIIPVLYQKCNIPPESEFQLAGLHIIDFSIQPAEQAIGELLKALDRKLVSSPPPRKERNVQVINKILPGRWQVQLNVQTYWGVQSGQLALSIHQNQFFHLQNQFFQVRGNWSIPQFNQVILNGIQTNGYMQMPYYTAIQFTDIDNNLLQGITSGNETAIWRRV